MPKVFLIIFLSFISCHVSENKNSEASTQPDYQSLDQSIYLTVLGNVQDAGSPHMGCKKDCCASLFGNPDPMRKVVSLGLIDNVYNNKYLFEATPDVIHQVNLLHDMSQQNNNVIPDGVFLTHAHIGHYTGLMFFGKEAINTKFLPVYAMPRMHNFLSENGPWSQLVSDKNIKLHSLKDLEAVQLSDQLHITPFSVPHRDEYSETVGYVIQGPEKSALFIPDIDKWEKWGKSITSEIADVDFAFLDATFYDAEEINNRNIKEIPHPFVIESMAIFDDLHIEQKNKIHFIHFNHTNPLLNPDSEQTKLVLSKGYNIARLGQNFVL